MGGGLETLGTRQRNVGCFPSSPRSRYRKEISRLASHFLGRCHSTSPPLSLRGVAFIIEELKRVECFVRIIGNHAGQCGYECLSNLGLDDIEEMSWNARFELQGVQIRHATGDFEDN